MMTESSNNADEVKTEHSVWPHRHLHMETCIAAVTKMTARKRQRQNKENKENAGLSFSRRGVANNVRRQNSTQAPTASSFALFVFLNNGKETEMPRNKARRGGETGGSQLTCPFVLNAFAVEIDTDLACRLVMMRLLDYFHLLSISISILKFLRLSACIPPASHTSTAIR
ncbi:hypothetical protein BKA80DRAFT_259784 [Phyllosticta citrichinensis]